MMLRVSHPEERCEPGISNFNFTFAQDHMPAAVSCQAQIALAAVGWVAAATGSLGSSADYLRLVLAQVIGDS